MSLLGTSYLDPLASGSTENPYTAGEVNEATLYLKDKLGNPATIPSNFASTVGSNFGSGTGSVVMTKISSGSTATVAISVTKIALNTRMPYDPVSKKWKSGTNMFNLTFDGVTVSGGGSANFMLYSQPGVPCTRTLNNCQGGNVTALECPVPRSVAGEFMNLTLRVYDIYGNEWKGDQVLMHILMDQTSPAFNVGCESLAVSTEMPGVYYLKFQGDRTTFANAKLDGNIVAQKYLFKVELPGPVYVYSDESDAAQACQVTPAATDVDKCVLYALDDGVPVSTFAAQQPDTDISYLVVTKDQYGNYQTGPNSEVFTMGYDQDARAPFGAVLCPSDSGIVEGFNLVYNWIITTPIYNPSLKGFVYTANTIKAGVYTVSMVLNGQAASCSTRKLWVQTICPGDPDGSKSYFDVLATDRGSSSPHRGGWNHLESGDRFVGPMGQPCGFKPILQCRHCSRAHR
eukprot:g66336.t1